MLDYIDFTPIDRDKALSLNLLSVSRTVVLKGVSSGMQHVAPISYNYFPYQWITSQISESAHSITSTTLGVSSILASAIVYYSAAVSVLLSVKLDNIKTLQDHENSETWAS